MQVIQLSERLEEAEGGAESQVNLCFYIIMINNDPKMKIISQDSSSYLIYLGIIFYGFVFMDGVNLLPAFGTIYLDAF